MKLSDINLLDVGNTLQLVGAVYADAETLYFCPFPEDGGKFVDGPGDDHVGFRPKDRTEALSVRVLDMDHADWEKFIKQTDLMETEVLAKASDGTLAKIILRKSARQIDTAVQWKVFKRDRYACRYCGNNDCPLTIDHLVTWEEGGPSIVENLVAACKRCNKIRGNTSYADWLKHPRYRETSKNLSGDVVQANEALLGLLDRIPRMTHMRSR